MTPRVKRAVAALAPAHRARGMRILLYHAVGEPDPRDWMQLRISPGAFEAQMALLRDEGYTVVPLAHVSLGAVSDAAHQIALTFDDGYQSQLAAADMLERMGWPATFFVVPQFLDGRNEAEGYQASWSYCTWEQVRELDRRGFDIGAHSSSHPKRLVACGPGELERETRGAKMRIEDRLGRSVISFSYPHGRYDERVIGAVAGAGYRLACTSVTGLNRPPWQRFALRRTEISGADRLEDFRRKLCGQYDWLGPWQRWRSRH